MEKDYCYEPYKANSLKRDTVVTTSSTTTSKTKKPPKNNNQEPSSCCCCFSKTKKSPSGASASSKTKAFFTGLATNLGICVLLFGYTLIGSLIFLAIEGGNTFHHHHLHHSTTQILATTSMASDAKNPPPADKFLNQSAELKARNDAARTRTVENIWEITVSLNILYRDNWTRLAAQEITRFQDELLKSLGEELALQPLLHQGEGEQTNSGRKVLRSKQAITNENYEWTFAKAFLYSLTVLTTIGYGSIAPRTALGKAVTMGYAMLGIPLTLLYLSSIGSILSRVARGVFSRALCCCLCSNCGYCCYDEKRMAEKERRMKKKRQQLELQQQIALQQEPFYVRSNSEVVVSNSKEMDSLSCTDNESKSSSMHGLSILAPILLCLGMMLVYICLGTFALYKLENWAILDGFYFCFMSLTTIGFGNMVPGTDPFINHSSGAESNNTTIWFCSIYIMSGMALTAMCFNVVHDEIVHRLKHQEKIITGAAGLKLNSTSFTMDDLTNSSVADPYNMTS